MKTLLLCLLLINFQTLYSQLLVWHEGCVVLDSDKVITGRISIEPVHDLILFEDNNSRMVYPAHSIRSLYFYDEVNNINRRFVSIIDKHLVRKQYHLFEVVLQGEITFLRQQKSKGNRPSDALDFNYYVRYDDAMVPLRVFKRKVYPDLLAKAGESLDDFISDNKLSANNDQNSIRIIEFYNRLFKSGETIARY